MKTPLRARSEITDISDTSIIDTHVSNYKEMTWLDYSEDHLPTKFEQIMHISSTSLKALETIDLLPKPRTCKLFKVYFLPLFVPPSKHILQMLLMFLLTRHSQKISAVGI